MKKYSQSNNLPSTELKKPKIDHKMLNKEGQRHRAARHRAVWLLSRGVAVIVIFALLLFITNFVSLQALGSYHFSSVLSGASYDGSDIILTSYRFDDSNGLFSILERGFGRIADFGDFISSSFGRVLGLSSCVYFLYSSLDSSVDRIPLDRQFIIAEPVSSSLFDAGRFYEVFYSTLPDVVYFQEVHFSGPEHLHNIALFDVNKNELYTFSSTYSSTFEPFILFPSYPKAIRAGYLWLDDYSSQSLVPIS
ncbi:MAG: hypothetical protein IKP68_03760 [Clostridia bacterium]|nr:hypothetical protein [Clostridia bacterium]